MSNAIAETNETPVAQTVQGADSILAVIDRASRDPNTDIEKMERLWGMYERMQARDAQQAFSDALADMQPELPSVAERGDAAKRYTYALWEDINKAIKPVMQKHGFSLTFRTDFADGVAVTGVLTHRKGHSEQTTIKLPADPSGNKNAVQAVASSVSYGKRYAAGALLNLTSHGEDDDAFAAGDKSAPIDADQLGRLKSFYDQLPEARQSAFLKWAKVSELSEIVQGAYKGAHDALSREADKQKKEG